MTTSRAPLFNSLALTTSLLSLAACGGAGSQSTADPNAATVAAVSAYSLQAPTGPELFLEDVIDGKAGSYHYTSSESVLKCSATYQSSLPTGVRLKAKMSKNARPDSPNPIVSHDVVGGEKLGSESEFNLSTTSPIRIDRAKGVIDSNLRTKVTATRARPAGTSDWTVLRSDRYAPAFDQMVRDGQLKLYRVGEDSFEFRCHKSFQGSNNECTVEMRVVYEYTP